MSIETFIQEKKQVLLKQHEFKYRDKQGLLAIFGDFRLIEQKRRFFN